VKLRVLSDKYTKRFSTPSVAISFRLKRITMNKHAFKMISKKFGSEVQYMQILLDDDSPGVFYLKPCLESDDSAKKLDKPSPGTRSLQISLLLKELGWSKEETTRFKGQWDEEVHALKVDTTES